MHLLSCKQCTLQNALSSGAVAGLLNNIDWDVNVFVIVIITVDK
jgi:hypothetical protein